MKKTLIATLFSLCSFTMAASTALAAPSLTGPTGLVLTPTADVPKFLSVGLYQLDEARIGTLNLTPLTNLELGVTLLDPDTGSSLNLFGTSSDRVTTVNAKWGFLRETLATPGLAVGVEDMGDKLEQSPYIVASKSLPLGFRVHAGTGGGRFKDKIFGGLEWTVNPAVVTGGDMFPATTLIAEYDGEEKNYGLRLSTIPGLKIEAGWQGLDEKFYCGLSFTY